MVTRALLLAFFALPALATGQPAPAAALARPDAAAASTPVPVRRVVLYKTGIGYFEHLGRVRDRQDVTIHVRTRRSSCERCTSARPESRSSM